MTTFLEQHQRFLKLREKVGASKMSSFSMQVYYSPEEYITIELGGYDIGDWSRHEHIGPFEDEEEALLALTQKIDEAYFIVEDEGNFE